MSYVCTSGIRYSETEATNGNYVTVTKGRVLHLISLVSWCLENYVILILVGCIMAIGSTAKYVSIILLQKVVTRVTH